MIVRHLLLVATLVPLSGLGSSPSVAQDHAGHHAAGHRHGRETVEFSIRSARDGKWSEPATWQPARLPRQGDRVLISRGTQVQYDVASEQVLRLVQVVGTLRFSRDCDTLLNVGVLKVQNSDDCSESGFACDFEGVNLSGEPQQFRDARLPLLEVGTRQQPIPAGVTARIRLHYLEGMDKQDAPALVCCSARMELHGAPLARTWSKLAADVRPGDSAVTISDEPAGWRVGDELLVTGSHKQSRGGSYRRDPEKLHTERRVIARIKGATLHLDRPLEHEHFGGGEFRSEVANLSRNVVVESADPDGVRGHTLYHRWSQGGISYARFAHLGKEGVLGRYAIHFHLVGDTMRGSSVIGAAIVDSHNRWITIHGTQYLLVRDCIGFRSVGHGYFLEDGTEVYNLLDRNLGIQAFRGRRLPEQVLPFDPNDGGAFWWANGRNTLTRNVACENDEYGYRYDSQKRSNFDSHLPVRMKDGSQQIVDIRTLPIHRFSENESHSEGLYSVAVAGTDGAGPDTAHPHRLSNLKLWQTHYALRAELPTMLVENVRIQDAAYGIYRPWFENHVYRNLQIASTDAEPFNRGLDDQDTQHGRITVDGLTFTDLGYGGQMPLIQISADNLSGDAESHFRNVRVLGRNRDDRWPLVNLGGGPRRQSKTDKGVPVYIHDYYGDGLHAKVVSTRDSWWRGDGQQYRADPPLTGDESVAATVKDVEFPELLQPTDDQPPATVILGVQRSGGKLIVQGVSHDDGQVRQVQVNGMPAEMTTATPGVTDWRIELDAGQTATLSALAVDDAGNIELTPHVLELAARSVAGDASAKTDNQ
ncbi:MAG: G8 domain-containing protein [Pirellulaceae bacterium]|nr:G8 domain-containing protein [Pirellulaceae bacterium]